MPSLKSMARPILFYIQACKRLKFGLSITGSSEDLPEKGFASLINRRRARTARLSLAHSRAPGIGKD
jgi:hypothetical protein